MGLYSYEVFIEKLRGANIYKKFGSDYRVYFGNGGDRTNSTTPEVDYCSKNSIEMLWGVGGDKKSDSSSDLVNKVRNFDERGVLTINTHSER